jgi:putative heme transporter
VSDQGEQRGARATFSVPHWLRQFGYASWLLIGIVIVLAGLGAALSAGRTIVTPTLFAALLGATFLPVVDWLERHRIKRWAGALLVTALIVVAALALTYVVVKGLVDQASTIGHQIDAAVNDIERWLRRYNLSPHTVESIKASVKRAGSGFSQGAVANAVRGIQSLAALVFGIFIALNILVYLLVSGRRIGHWLSTVVRPVPQPVAYAIIVNSVRFLRGYIWGSTIIGVFNGLVVGVGAVIIGVPLAATIGIVAWATNYIPLFGALIGGAFAVLIAMGVGGLQKAVLMLIIVIIANGPLQNVVSQFALGTALGLNGLVVLFATTIGAIVAGAIGGVFAAPFARIALDAYTRLRAAGLFDEEDAPRGDASGPPGMAPPAVDPAPPGP